MKPKKIITIKNNCIWEDHKQITFDQNISEYELFEQVLTYKDTSCTVLNFLEAWDRLCTLIRINDYYEKLVRCNNHLHFILGCFPSVAHKELIKLPNVTIQHRPIHWFCQAVSDFAIHPFEFDGWEVKEEDWKASRQIWKKHLHLSYSIDEFRHTFISLNRVCHVHRAKFIREIEKAGLLSTNIVTFHQSDKLSNPINEYPNPPSVFSKLESDQSIYHEWSNGAGLPTQSHGYQSFYPWDIHYAFVQVVVETHDSMPFISEKTVYPLLYGKPFIVLNAQGFHKSLQQLGFHLYTEIFDYSFDSELNVDNRIQGVVQNLTRLSQLSPKEWNSLYQSIIPKLIHNCQRAYELSIEAAKSIVFIRRTTTGDTSSEHALTAEWRCAHADYFPFIYPKII